MGPLLGLAVRVGVGAIAGSRLMRSAMRPRSQPKRLAPIGVGAVNRSGINWANGVRYAQDAQVFLNRGDLQSAIVNAISAQAAAGALGGYSGGPITAQTVPLSIWTKQGYSNAQIKQLIQNFINYVLGNAGVKTAAVSARAAAAIPITVAAR